MRRRQNSGNVMNVVYFRRALFWMGHWAADSGITTLATNTMNRCLMRKTTLASNIKKVILRGVSWGGE